MADQAPLNVQAISRILSGLENRDTCDRPRVMVLWEVLPSYLAACLRILLSDYELPVLLILRSSDPRADDKDLRDFPHFKMVDLSSSDSVSETELEHLVRAYRPTVALVGSPKLQCFVRVARVARQVGALTVSATDHFWKGNWRDHINWLLARFGLVYSCYDAAFVPGRRGRDYARRMGFRNHEIFEGVLSCDAEIFRVVGNSRFGTESSDSWPSVFLYLGQYIKRKNLETLLHAYEVYRENEAMPWELWCAGAGPLKDILRNHEGVKDWGYQNATGCVSLMAQAGAFVLPSWVDHWGVVIHEAACAGLPILATHSCGASTDLVRDGYNGFSFDAADSKRLALFLRLISRGDVAREMGRNSLRMSYQFGPGLWARTLLVDIPAQLHDETMSLGDAPGKESIGVLRGENCRLSRQDNRLL
jgi:glycosyltransferase involved in cell wall biosynthesis